MKKEEKVSPVDLNNQEFTQMLKDWANEDKENRCVLLIVGARENKDDSGNSSIMIQGQGKLLLDSFNACAGSSQYLENIIDLVSHQRVLRMLLEKEGGKN